MPSYLPLDDAYNDFHGLPSSPISIFHSGPAWLLSIGPQAQRIPKEAGPICNHAIAPVQSKSMGTSTPLTLSGQALILFALPKLLVQPVSEGAVLRDHHNESSAGGLGGRSESGIPICTKERKIGRSERDVPLRSELAT